MRKKPVFQPSAGNANSILILQLSLFIMLLAFFIVLNVTSNFEENKVQPVIQSLYRAFSTNLSPNLPELPTQRTVAANLQRQQAVNIFEDIFKADLPDITKDTVLDEDRGILTVALSREDFENAIFDQNPIALDRIIASMIFLEQSGQPFALEIGVYADKNNPEELQNVIRQQESYAAQFLRKGVRKKYVSLGLINAQDTENRGLANIILSFRPHIPYAPDVTDVEERGSQNG